MSLTDSSLIRLHYTDNTGGLHQLDIPKPNRGYSTEIIFPFTISTQSDGTFSVYDSGPDGSIDVRQCQCDFFLTETEQAALFSALWTDASARAREVSIELSTGSGFFPFGPDLGDGGVFPCSIEIVTAGSIAMAPFRLFKNTFRLTLAGTPPAYSLPSDETVGQGPVTIGTVAGLRFPDIWFQSGQGMADKRLVLHGGESKYLNKSVTGDQYKTSFELRMRTSKATRLIKYLSDTGRADAIASMAFVVPNGSYPFGRNKSTGGTFQAQMIQDRLKITHQGFNHFNMALDLAYISG